MQIARIQSYNNAIHNNNRTNQQTQPKTVANEVKQITELSNVYYHPQISFSGKKHYLETFNPNRTVPHIDFAEYKTMTDNTKQRFRKRYESFFTDKIADPAELYDQNYHYMPLRTEKDMDEFIKVVKIYSQYKDRPIICLGRSPKWFLNASLWMKDGIDNYNFVAFSKYWYYPNGHYGLRHLPQMAPTEKEELAYRKYLRRVSADPKTIVENFEKTGKRTVITDYICSGKGVSSFLDVMSHYAEDLGILDKFARSIEIVGIGSMEYMENLNPYADELSEPSVLMPPRLQKYDSIIPQRFYNIKSYPVFVDMLLNQNTNECRSTYYPHNAWTVYKPDQFKTGLIKDMKKVKEVVKTLGSTRSMASFTPAMFDFRNLLNFRILDALNQRNLLKDIHIARI
ncbi:MAG: hypothetical protein ACI37Q_02635 [Candidatus Gastranaerophilaceae bacterium]